MIYRLIRPLLFRLDPERAHDLATALLSTSAHIPGCMALLGSLLAFRHPLLATTCLNQQFMNPLGVAAGFDKRAVLIEGLAALGFGHVEVGTITPRPQPGNPRPRMFRLPEDAALINRLGFNSPGMVVVEQALQKAHSRNPHVAIGVNIGKNRDTPLERASEDYVAAFNLLAPYADYVAINISSPNTPGLRQLHERSALEELLQALSLSNRNLAQPRPLLLKISPDESNSQIEMVVAVGIAAGFAGIIATNTTTERIALRSSAAHEIGGLSGRPLAVRSKAIVQQIRTLAQGQIAIIAVGGITTGNDAYARIRAGANLVQLYTALIYRGPGVAGRIARELVECILRDGFRTLADVIGVDCI